MKKRLSLMCLTLSLAAAGAQAEGWERPFGAFISDATYSISRKVTLSFAVDSAASGYRQPLIEFKKKISFGRTRVSMEMPPACIQEVKLSSANPAQVESFDFVVTVPEYVAKSLGGDLRNTAKIRIRTYPARQSGKLAVAEYSDANGSTIQVSSVGASISPVLSDRTEDLMNPKIACPEEGARK